MLSLNLKHVAVRYEDKLALEDVTYRAQSAQLIGVTGILGAGKTSLLRAIAGRVSHTGIIRMEEEGIELSADHVAWTSPKLSLLPAGMTLEGYMQLALMNDSWEFVPHAQSQIMRTLVILGLDDLRKKPLSSLCTEARQMAVFAARLVNEPRIVLLDEDLTIEDCMKHLLHYVKTSGAIGIAAFDKSANKASAYADQILELDHGRLIA